MLNMLFSLVWNQTAITDTHFHLTCFLDAMKNKGITMHAGKSADDGDDETYFTARLAAVSIFMDILR